MKRVYSYKTKRENNNKNVDNNINNNYFNRNYNTTTSNNDNNNNSNSKSSSALSQLVYKFDNNALRENDHEHDNLIDRTVRSTQSFKSNRSHNNHNPNHFTNKNTNYKIDNRELFYLENNSSDKFSDNTKRMDERRGAIDFEQNNNLDDDQEAAVNSLILNTIKSSLEKNSTDIGLIRAASIMPARFKEAFETIIKVCFAY